MRFNKKIQIKISVRKISEEQIGKHASDGIDEVDIVRIDDGPSQPTTPNRHNRSAAHFGLFAAYDGVSGRLEIPFPFDGLAKVISSSWKVVLVAAFLAEELWKHHLISWLLHYLKQ